MMLALPRKLARTVWARPGLSSAIIHASGLGIRLVFILAVVVLKGPALLGVYGILTSIELVAIYLSGFEFHTFTTRRYARHPSQQSLGQCLAAHRSMLLVSTPLAIVGSALAIRLLNIDLDWKELAAFSLIVATGTAVQEMVRFVVMMRKPVMSVAVLFIRSSGWQPFALLVLFAFPDVQPVKAIVFLWAIAAALSFLVVIWLLRDAVWRPYRIRFAYLIHGLRVSGNYYVTANATVLQGHAERFILQAFVGPAAVGVYTFFQNLSGSLPAIVQSAVLNLWLPGLLEGFGRRQAERFDLLKHVIGRATLVSVVMSVGIFAGAIAVAVLTGHPNYLAMMWMLAVLLTGQIIQMATNPIHLSLYGAHRDRALMISSVTVLAVTTLLGIVLVKRFGIEGAILSQLVGGVLLVLVRLALLRVYIKRDLI